jgi:signal transduction histidine kinase
VVLVENFSTFMNSQPWAESLMPRTGRAFTLGVSLALAVLALTIFGGWLLVRSLVRQQIVQRDAEALHATTQMEQLDARGDTPAELLLSDEQVGFDAAIRASRLKGVIGIRFFDAGGRFKDSFPATIMPRQLSPQALEAVNQLRPFSRFAPDTPLSEVFIYLPQFATGNVARVATLRVTVPLHHRDSTNVLGAAQFILDGESIAREYARLDRHLGGLAAAAFAVSGLLLVGMLWPAFRQVGRLNRELAQRNERLSRANQELALSARASALGAISAHLMHGLKNPLASLSQFVRGQGSGSGGQEEMQDALTAARRMQQLVEQTLEVLADARGEPAYEVTVKELIESAVQRVQGMAAARGVLVSANIGEEFTLSSRAGNLLRLILVNLLENAVQVSAPGQTVLLATELQKGSLRLRVQDQGPGFPEHLRRGLFLPCCSTREGGSGLGLAISKQLAEHLGAKLELKDGGSSGCVFAVELPASRARDTEAAGGAASGDSAH